jgi:Cu(I)-responsive transcriptional regulator
MNGITIGEAARQAACNVKTVRYYEEIGLLPPPPRSGGGQRLYDASHVERLVFIRRARELGFPLQTIRALLDLSDEPGRSCEAVDEIARERLAEVERRIAALESLRNELQRMIDACEGGRIAECRIIGTLGESTDPAPGQ